MPTSNGSPNPKAKRWRGIIALSVLALIFMVIGATLGFVTYAPVTTDHKLTARTSPSYLFQTDDFPLSQQITVKYSYSFVTHISDYFDIIDLGSTHQGGSNQSYIQRFLNHSLPYLWAMFLPSGSLQENGSLTFSTSSGSWILVGIFSVPSSNSSEFPPVLMTVRTSNPVALVGLFGTGAALTVGALLLRRYP